jgi:transcriptional regulator with XRE-family HTH domain
MTKKSHKELVKVALTRTGVKQEYDALSEEFSILNELLHARMRAGKTQEQVAKKMKTTTSAVGRLESAGGKQKHSPTITTLQKYARALGCALKITLVPFRIYSPKAILRKRAACSTKTHRLHSQLKKSIRKT